MSGAARWAELERESRALDGVEANFACVLRLPPPSPDAWPEALRRLSARAAAEPGSARVHALLGKAYANLSRHGEARAALRKALRLDPRHARARAWLGQLDLVEGRFASAEKRLAAALAGDPRYAWARFLLAASRLGRGDAAGAGRALDALRGRSDAACAALALRALLDAGQGRGESAARRLRALRERAGGAGWTELVAARVAAMTPGPGPSAPPPARPAPSPEREACERAEALFRAGKGRAAESLLRRALRGGPAPEAAALLARLCAASGRPEAALPFLRGEAAERAASATLDAATEDLAAGCYERARGRAGLVLRRQPRSARAFFVRGKSFRAQERLGPALADYATACRFAPADLGFALHLAEASLLAGRWRRALRVLDRARAAAGEAGSVEELLRLYRVEAHRFSFEAAARLGERVLGLTRRFEHLQALSWVCLIDDFKVFPRPAGYLAAARAALRRPWRERRLEPWRLYFQVYFAGLADPSAAPDPSPLRRLPRGRYGWMLYEAAKSRLHRRDFAGAAADFAAAAASVPGDWRALCFLGETQALRRDPRGCDAAFRRAARVVPARDLAGLRQWRGEVLLWAGRYREALAELERARSGGVTNCAHLCGRALVKLGRPARGLRLLSAAVPEDRDEAQELRLWRAEALLRLGRPHQARREAALALREALRRRPREAGEAAPRVLRALAAAALGDEAAMRRDVAALDGLLERGAGRRGLERLLARMAGVRAPGFHASLWLAAQEPQVT